MFTTKRISIALTILIVIIIMAAIEIGVLEMWPRSSYIWEGPFTGIKDGQDGSLVQGQGQGGTIRPDPSIATIAFLVPGRSIQGWTIENIPLLRLFIPSLLTTITPDEFRDFNYVVYFGCDNGDPLYDNDEAIAELYDIVGKIPEIELHMFSFGNTQGKPVLVWNRLFEKAYEDGCQYFYQVNDDVTFISSGWSTAFVHALRTNPVFPDLGVTGPKDIGSSILTQSFTSRIHMHVFGYFYPPLFDNWYSDDWMTHVYDDVGSAFSTGPFLIQNDNSQGTRYKVDHAGGDSLDILLRNGKVAVREFLETHAPGPSIYSDPVHKDASRRRPGKRSHVPGDTINQSSLCVGQC